MTTDMTKPGGHFDDKGSAREVADTQVVRNQGPVSADEYPEKAH